MSIAANNATETAAIRRKQKGGWIYDGEYEERPYSKGGYQIGGSGRRWELTSPDGDIDIYPSLKKAKEAADEGDSA